mmetsp:Transcript_15069/g.46886  ORF Transcript_15069/g.46886 Transcript_15069/m.46886 type:complete len:214 (+) Transcript_15069:35-676(+)
MDGPTHWLYHRANVSPASSFEFARARRGEIPDADGFDSVLMGSECSPSSSAWPAKSLEAASLLADTVAAGIAENVAASFVVEGRFPFDELRFFVRRCFCEVVGAAFASPPSVAVTTVAGSVVMVPGTGATLFCLTLAFFGATSAIFGAPGACWAASPLGCVPISPVASAAAAIAVAADLRFGALFFDDLLFLAGAAPGAASSTGAAPLSSRLS